MKNKVFFILMALLMPVLAEAKIVLCNKKCSELRIEHINPIKGLIYELAQSQEASVKKIFIPHAAKTIVWMNKLHKDKKIYNLEDYDKDDRAKLITTCVEYIVKVIRGEEDLPVEKTMIRGNSVGKRVIAEYKEKKTVVKWKLELSKE